MFDFDAYVDVRFHLAQATYACACACVATENQALRASVYFIGCSITELLGIRGSVRFRGIQQRCFAGKIHLAGKLLIVILFRWET